MIFVNSMSDLFHSEVPESYIVAVARVISAANWHTYQVLTKRSDRLRKLLDSTLGFAAKQSHIWWGVSVEDKKYGLPRIDDLRKAWFRQLDLAPFDRLIWPHPAGELSPSREPPPGLVGTVESAFCFPSRCGNPRSLRISISGVSFHRPPFSFFFASFFFLCACPQFSTEKYRARILSEQRSPTRSTHNIPGFCLLPSSLAAFFLFQRSAETIRLRARLDNVGLVGQPVQHRLA